MSDIKISDEELSAEVERAQQEVQYAEEILSGLYSIISQIDNNSIKGETQKNFTRFVSMVESMQGQLDYLVQEKAQLVTKFIADIDEADMALF